MGTTAWAIAIAVALQSPPPGPTARTAGHDVNPFTHILQNLVKDAAALPSKTSAEILLAGSAGAGAARGLFDHAVADWAGRAGSSSYTRPGDVWGLGAVQGAMAVATYAVGKIGHKPTAAHIGSDLIRTQLLTGVLTHGVKFAVGRTRPNGGSRSFPSGHSSAAFATAAVLSGHFGWKAWPAYAVAGYTAWTRNRDHVHYPSDSIFGATLGIMVGATVTRGHRQRTWTVVPTRTPGGIAVYVVRQPVAPKPPRVG